MAPNGDVTLGEVYRRLERMDERVEQRFNDIEATQVDHGKKIAVLVAAHGGQLQEAHAAGRVSGAKWGTGAGAVIGAVVTAVLNWLYAR